MENHAQLESVWTAWRQAVWQRAGQHAFAQPSRPDGVSALEKLLRRIFDRHYRNPLYAQVAAPLPGLPLLPLDQRWVELRLVESAQARSYSEQLLRNLESRFVPEPTQSVARVLSGHESLVISGAPGAGKTTMLKWAARYLIGEPRSLCLIPLYLPLRSFSAWLERNPEGDLYRFFAAQHRLTANEQEAFFHFMMDVEDGARELRYLCRVLLDGWDEVPVSQRPRVLTSLERFEWVMPVILTSRPSGMASGFSLSFARSFAVAPLSFESMRALMHEWFNQARQPEWEAVLCRHLDENLSLRELARNPFVLTLLCAVVTHHEYALSTRLPLSRAQLYQAALRLFAEYCDSHFRHEGFPFNAEIMQRVEQTAFALFRREDVSPYEFSLPELAQSSKNETLAATLEKARLITLTKEYEQRYSFLHATIHEFLAARELRRRWEDEPFDFKNTGMSARWLQVLLFLFGLETPEAASPVWRALARWCRKPDRFGLVVVHTASLLAEAGVVGGGQSLFGVDVRALLWDLFCQAPAPRLYAQALIELDAEYVFQRARELQGGGMGVYKKLILLHLLIAPHHPRRSELTRLAAGFRLQPTTLAEDPEVEDFVEYLGASPTAAHSLAMAGEFRSAVEIIQQIAGETSEQRQHTCRMSLALTRSVEAEDYLSGQLREVTGGRALEDLAEALATLGTLAARDALLAVIPKFASQHQELAVLLMALFDLPISEGAETLLQFVAPSYPQEIRVNAAMALGRCCGPRSDGWLNRLGDYARLEEPQGEVRKAALLTLARAQSFAMIRCLANEGVRQRTEPSEFKIAWDYLLAMAAEINPANDYSQSLPLIEQMLLEELDRGAEASPYVVAQAWALGKYSSQVCQRLLQMVSDEEYPLEVRAAACQAIGKLKLVKARSPLLATLDHCLTDASRLPLAQEAARALAWLAPTSLLKKDHPIVAQVLWQMSVATRRMIFGQRIVDPEVPAQTARTGNTRLPDKFRVALTFAGEQRDYVAAVARHLSKRLGKKQIFYDEWYVSALAQTDLDLRLIEIYRQADLVVPFLSADYEKKMWCRLEWRVIRSLLLERRNDVMFCRFDEVEIPGLFPQDGYLDARKYDPAKLARLIRERLLHS